MIDPTKPLEATQPLPIETQPSQQINAVEDEEIDLNEKQELFCQYYATDREFFGNGVESYLEVYEINKSKPNWYKTACSAASRLLSDVKVYTRINELLSSDGLNDQNVDKQLLFLVNQHDDKKAKIAAIKEYNALKTRIQQKIDLTSQGEKIATQTIILDTRPPETSPNP